MEKRHATTIAEISSDCTASDNCNYFDGLIVACNYLQRSSGNTNNEWILNFLRGDNREASEYHLKLVN
jgi:hypothetical protein